jgi:hypothetical protein
MSFEEFDGAYHAILRLLDVVADTGFVGFELPEGWERYDEHLAVLKQNRDAAVTWLVRGGEKRPDARNIVKTLIDGCERVKRVVEMKPHDTLWEGGVDPWADEADRQIRQTRDTVAELYAPFRECKEQARQDAAAESVRLRIDWEAMSATLDGHVYPDVDPDALAVLGVFLEAGAGQIIPTPKLIDRVPRCGHDSTLRRWLDRLPPPLRACIHGKPGSGRWLQLPAR